jgi:hypothetical protein
LFPDVAFMEYEPVCALLFTLPALPEVLHDPVVSNPGLRTKVPAETDEDNNIPINVATFLIMVWPKRVMILAE